MKNLLIIVLVLYGLAANAQNFVKFRLGSNATSAIAYSPDRAYLAINEGSEILLYTAGTSTLARKIKTLKAPVLRMHYNDVGTYLFVAFTDGSLSAIDLSTGAVSKTYKAPSLIIDAAYLNDMKVAFITDKAACVYDFETEKLLYEKAEHTRPIRSLAISGDGKKIVTGGGDGKLVVYDAFDGRTSLNEKIHKGWIRAVDFNPESSLLASGDDEGVVIVSDLHGQLIARFEDAKGWVTSLKFSDDGKFIAVGDQKGNCLIYSTGRNSLSQRISELGFPLHELSFRSDGKELAVLEEMKGVSVLDVSELNISPVFKVKDEKDNTPPQILISNPPNIQDDRFRYSQNYINIKGIVVDDSGVRSLRINGIETPLKDNGNFVLHLALTRGENFVTIEAADINENTSVKKFLIIRKDLDGEEYDAARARNFLFIVGINDYQHWPKLNNAVKDATDIASSLLNGYDFDLSNVVMLKNEQATRSNIYKGLRSLVEQITPQDNLLIYFSGHGYFDELLNEGYWVPVDGKIGSSGDYLSNSDLLKIIGTIDSQHTFLVADACFSGSLFSDSKRGYTENVEKFKSRWGLASGRLEVVSDGTLNQNSPFTGTLIDFLKNNKKEKFTVSELIQYVKVKVAEKADQTPLGNPLKGAGDEGGEFIFYKKR